jgi:hypothetical protein
MNNICSQELGLEKWDKVNDIEKVINFGQYLLDNYNYTDDNSCFFHKDGSGNSRTTAFVLSYVARNLSLEADIFSNANKKYGSSDYVTRVVTSDAIYYIDASAKGTAPRGKVSVLVESK